jgi:glycerol-3-phosphate cytidylyltransferase
VIVLAVISLFDAVGRQRDRLRHHGKSPDRAWRGPEQTGGSMTVIGYAPGAYDLFHIGHLNILRHAKENCDRLIAGVVSDEMLLRTKGRLPVVPLAERLEIVRNIRYVDDVHAEVVPDKIDTWQDVRFDVIFKGDDWRGTAKGEKLERDFAAVGVEVRYFPYTMHTSSTMLRKALLAIDSGAPAGREVHALSS